MKNVLLSVCWLFLFHNQIQSQSFTKAASKAFLITRMAEKFHVHPAPVDDAFSLFVFNKIINVLDDEKIYFTAEDIAALQAYRLQLDDEILKQKTGFLQAITTLYAKRLRQSDSLINFICARPFVFTVNETLTAAEDTTFPFNEAAQRTKLYNILKYDVLNELTDDDTLSKLFPAQQKNYVDSLEPKLRRKMQACLATRH